MAHNWNAVPGDVRDYETVLKATSNIDYVYHLAAINGTENFYKKASKVLEVGVKGVLNTMDASIACNCEKYIFASSAEVYQEPTSIPTNETERLIIPDVLNARYSYSSSKLIGEMLSFHYLSKSEVKPIVFRPHNIYGPDMGN